jgi:hypothetical protein
MDNLGSTQIKLCISLGTGAQLTRALAVSSAFSMLIALFF